MRLYFCTNILRLTVARGGGRKLILSSTDISPLFKATYCYVQLCTVEVYCSRSCIVQKKNKKRTCMTRGGLN